MSGTVDETRKSLTDLSRILEVVDKQTIGFARNIANAGQESKKWTFLARILSGSGLWKLQARLRAVAQAFDFYFKAQENAMKLQAENLEGLAQLQEAQEGIAENLGVLTALENSHNAALTEGQQKNKAITGQFKLLKSSMKRAREELGLSTDEAILNKKATESLKGSYVSLQEKLTKLANQRVREMQKVLSKEEKLELQEALKKTKRAIKDIEDNKNMVKRAEKDLAKLKKGGKSPWKIAEKQEKIKELKEQRNLIKLQGVKAKTGPLKMQMALQKKLLRGPFTKILLGAMKSLKMMTLVPLFMKLKKMGIKKVLGSVWKIVKMAIGFSLYFILFIVGAFLIFAIIKKIFSKGEMMATVMETLSGIFEGMKMTLSGFVDIFNAFFGEGTFGEKLKTLMSGFGKIFGGLGTILWSVGLGILKFGFKFVVGFWSLIFKGIILIFSNFTKMEFWRDKIIKPIKDWVNDSVIPWAKKYFSDKAEQIKQLFPDFWTKWLKPKLYDPLYTILSAVKTKVEDAYKWIKNMEWWASGGVSKGGLAMVGERGPELVNLPAGSRVTSAPQTKRMLGGISNTINVSVNGRVGASDSELRDIAKKIGRMVSAEINRSTSSSTNLRY